MVNRLQNVKAAGKSSRKATKLVAQLKTDFDKHMNNDLHVKHAFEATFRNVSKLLSLAERGGANIEDLDRANANLKEIDGVLQVIF
jgi:cysteinyl-tRNA synthetase